MGNTQYHHLLGEKVNGPATKAECREQINALKYSATGKNYKEALVKLDQVCQQCVLPMLKPVPGHANVWYCGTFKLHLSHVQRYNIVWYKKEGKQITAYVYCVPNIN